MVVVLEPIDDDVPVRDERGESQVLFEVLGMGVVELPPTQTGPASFAALVGSAQIGGGASAG